MILKNQRWWFTLNNKRTAIGLEPSTDQIYCPYHKHPEWMYSSGPCAALKHFADHLQQGDKIPREAFDYIHSWLSYKRRDTWQQ